MIQTPVIFEMLFQNLSPSRALSIAQFSDIDAFRPVEFVAEARSVPLNLVNFHTARAIVPLPFFTGYALGLLLIAYLILLAGVLLDTL